jgi:hypothetical protein
MTIQYLAEILVTFLFIYSFYCRVIKIFTAYIYYAWQTDYTVTVLHKPLPVLGNIVQLLRIKLNSNYNSRPVATF